MYSSIHCVHPQKTSSIAVYVFVRLCTLNVRSMYGRRVWSMQYGNVRFCSVCVRVRKTTFKLPRTVLYGFVRFCTVLYGFVRCTVLYGFVRFVYGVVRFCTVRVLFMYGCVRLCTVHVRFMYGPCTVHVRSMYGPCTVSRVHVPSMYGTGMVCEG